jgi:hypothetical protein
MSDALAGSLATLTRHLAVRHEADAALLARYTSANDSTALAELVRRQGPPPSLIGINISPDGKRLYLYGVAA